MTRTPGPWITKPHCQNGLVNIYHAAGIHNVAIGATPEDGKLIAKAPEMLDALVSLVNLVLAMGHTIRALDEGEHSEHWTHDGEYLADGGFLRAQDLIAAVREDRLDEGQDD